MKSRVIFWGVGVPLVVGMMAILTIGLMAASNTAWGKQAGPLPNLLLILPGTLILGLLIGLPIAAAHVFTIAWLSRHLSLADSAAAWALSGPLFSMPLTLILWSFDAPGGPPYALLFGVALGLIGGLSAGLSRPKNVR